MIRKYLISLILLILLIPFISAWSTNTFNVTGQTSENLTTTGDNIFRYIGIPTNTILTNAYLNISGYELKSPESIWNNGIINYWNLNNQLGNNISTGLGLTNNSCTNSVTMGKIEGGYYCGDDSADYLKSGTITGLGTKNFSFSGWVNITSNGTTGNYILNEPVNIYYDPEGWLWCGLNETHNYFINSQWTHIVYIQNDTEFKCYVNGIKRGNGTATTLFPTTNYLSLGGHAPITDWSLNGWIDEIGIWNRSLTESEIAKLYNSGNGLSFNTSIPTYPQDVVVFGGNYDYADDEQIFSDGTSFTTTNQTKNFAVNFNRYTTLCNCDHCSLRSGFCYVPFIFSTTDTQGVLGYSNLVFNNLGFIENNQTFNSSTYETLSESFSINLTYDSSFYTGISANLVYNNTNYAGTKIGTGNTIQFSKTLSIPSISADTNKTFYWIIALTNSSGTSYFNSTFNNQTIKNFGIDDCSAYSNRILNISLKDEEFKTYLTGNIEVSLTYSNPANPSLYISYFNNFTNRNNVSICMENLTYGNILDTTIRYSATNYETEYYYIDNHILTSGELPIIINLYDLNSTASTSYLNTYRDCSYLLTGNAIIETWRKYVSEGTFYLVEMSKTNEVGQAVNHLVSEDIMYKYYVKKDGVLQYITDEFPALCIDTPCRVNILQKGTYCDTGTFEGWESDPSITYTFNYDDTTRYVTFEFSTVDGSTATLNLSVTQFSVYLNNTICSKQMTSAGGTLSCYLPTSLINATYYAEVRKNNNYLTAMFVNTNTDAIDVFGLDGVLFTTLLVLTLGLIFISTGWGVLVVSLLGFIVASTLSLIAFNWTLLIWLAVAILIVIIKIARKENSG